MKPYRQAEVDVNEPTEHYVSECQRSFSLLLIRNYSKTTTSFTIYDLIQQYFRTDYIITSEPIKCDCSIEFLD